jgi:hypothetical protein
MGIWEERVDREGLYEGYKTVAFHQCL